MRSPIRRLLSAADTSQPTLRLTSWQPQREIVLADIWHQLADGKHGTIQELEWDPWHPYARKGRYKCRSSYGTHGIHMRVKADLEPLYDAIAEAQFSSLGSHDSSRVCIFNQSACINTGFRSLAG